MIYRAYRITHLQSGKSYVGVTRSALSKRLSQHRGKRSLLGDTIRREGRKAFQIEELCICLSRKTAFDTERSLIKRLGTRYPRGYNKTAGGELGLPHKQSTKHKLRKLKLGRKMSATARANMSKAQKGRKHTAATKAKMSAWHKGKKVSKATRLKIGRAQTAYWDRQRQSVIDYIKRLRSRGA